MNEQARLPIKRALLSVSDKTGILELAQNLAKNGVELLATGGTYKLLQEEQIKVTEVSSYTGFPEIMAGRVKTLHPKIHGGLLGRRDLDADVMARQQILPIDLLVVNLYPFAQTVEREDCVLADAIENIDIGGPAMLRSGAKNHQFVSVLVDPKDYVNLSKELEQGGTTAAMRFNLACKAFAHTANYDGMISNYLSALNSDGSKQDFAESFNLQFNKVQDLRYGENPHQQAAFYQASNVQNCIANAVQVQGKELSYNNIADADTALECVKTFSNPACVIVKHGMPCGVAEDVDICAAYERAFAADSESAFGGVIALNSELDAEIASAIINRQFVEVIIAPNVSLAAKQILATKPNVRVLACGAITPTNASELNYKKITGGLLVQTLDTAMVTFTELKVVTTRAPSTDELNNLLFAWKVAKYAKSNAIVYAKNMQTIGISARIAGNKAEHAGFEVKGAVMASDAFFPFRDSIDAAAELGIKAIIQPGGSIRDNEVIAAANDAQMAMIFTGMRHFRH